MSTDIDFPVFDFPVFDFPVFDFPKIRPRSEMPSKYGKARTGHRTKLLKARHRANWLRRKAKIITFKLRQ